MSTHITPTRSAVCLGLFLSLVFHSQTLFSSIKAIEKGPCYEVENLEKEGKYAEAIAKYKEVLKDPDLPEDFVSCAKQGLDNLDWYPQLELRCDIAKKFEEEGDFEEAIANYREVLKAGILKNSLFSCAVYGLISVKKRFCDNATESFNAGRVEEAEKLFLKLLSDSSPIRDLPCASKGLQDIAQEYITRGMEQISKNDLGGAKSAYDSAFRISKDVTEAQDKLNEVIQNMRISELSTLVEFGLEDSAKEKLKTYLEEDPTLLDADSTLDQKKLKHLSNTLRPGGLIWTEISKTSVDNVLSFPAKIPSLLTQMSIIEALVWVFLIWLAGRKFWWGSPALSIGSFSPNDKKLDHTIFFAADLQHQLIDLTSTASPSHNVFMVTGFIDESSVPSIGKALPVPAQLLESLTLLLPKLFARRSLEVTGLIHTVPKKGVENEVTIDGVIIQIASGKRILAKHALFAKDFGCSDSNFEDHLALCAASWIIFMLQQKPVQWYAILKSFFKRICNQPPIKILGTSDWEAYAWFELGNKYGRADMLEKAEAAYLKSLSIDPFFLASRVNLAGIYSLQTDQKKAAPHYKKIEIKKLQLLAIQQLNFVECEEKNGGVKRDDPIRYTWLFSRAMINFERGKDAEDWTDPSKDADELVHRICKRRWLLWFFNPRLNEYLNWRYPIAECMRLGLQTVFAHMAEETGLQKITKDLAVRMDYYSLYNLACTYALFATFVKDQKEKNKLERECYYFLEKSLDIISSGTLLVSGIVKFERVLRRLVNDTSFNDIPHHRVFKKIVTQASEKLKKAKDSAKEENTAPAIVPPPKPTLPT